MGRYICILLGLMGIVAQASQPIYYFPSLIRGTQLMWQHEQIGTPNGAVQFIGPFWSTSRRGGQIWLPT